MKVNHPSSTYLVQKQNIQQPTLPEMLNKSIDPIMAELNNSFYQKLKSATINNVKDILTLLRYFDVKNDNNQTLKNSRQLALLMFAHQQSEVDDLPNKKIINQALVEYISYQGAYNQFVLDLTGMVEHQEYEDFYKPDNATFNF